MDFRDHTAGTCLDQALTAHMARIPGCMGAAVIDLNSAAVVAMHAANTHALPVSGLLGSATADLFLGERVQAIEAYRDAHPTDGHTGPPFPGEVIAMSQHLTHLFLRSRRFENYVATFVYPRRANFGLVLSRCREALPDLDSALLS